MRGDPSSFESCRCRFAGCELGDGGPRAGIVTARRATEDGADKFATGSEMKEKWLGRSDADQLEKSISKEVGLRCSRMLSVN